MCTYMYMYMYVYTLYVCMHVYINLHVHVAHIIAVVTALLIYFKFVGGGEDH